MRFAMILSALGDNGGRVLSAEEVGDLLDFSGAVDAGDGAFGGAEEGAGLGVKDFVGVVDADVGLLEHLGDDFDFVIVAGGAFEVDGDAGDDEENVALFEFAVADAAEAEEFDAAHFEEGEVVGVVEVAHGVAFDVADALGEVGFNRAGISGLHDWELP